MDIQFDYRGDPVGGNITNYLLEKSRVVHQAKGERNFHIFYQVFSDGLLKGTPEDYFYLKQSGVTKVKTINDAEDYKNVKNAMKVIGFSETEISSLLNLVASVIYLGNINFETQGQTLRIANPDSLKEASRLLGTTEKNLQTALLERTVATSKEVLKSLANEEQAVYARDAFAKGVYERLFSWLVQRINQSIRHKPGYGEDITVIGVLDIYGFEIFEVNSFEQFCINYCNEKLQQLFIELTLKAEQEEYRKEGIQWEDVKYFDNAIICNMIDAPQKGMIAILDEECLRPGKTSDQTFLEKMNEVFKEHKHYESAETNRKDKSLERDVFRIKHYAGDVTYRVTSFLDKNTDSLFKDLKSVGYNSSNPIAKEIFPDGASINESSKRPITAGTSFKTSLADLVSNLVSKNPHYVRCIKPNSKKASYIFDRDLCLHQVRYLGLLENVRVRRAGFAYRQQYEVWLNRYRMLAKQTWPTYKGAAKNGVELLCKALALKPDEYRMGVSKIFIRYPQTLFRFEEEREKSFDRMAVTMQKMWKGYKARKQWKRLKAVIKIQLKWRSYKSKKYHFDVYNVFKDVATMPDYGKNVPYPPHPSILERFSKLLRKIHLNWRAKMIVKKLSKDQQILMRKKILAYDIFRKKKPWNPSGRFYGNKMATDPVKGQKFSAALDKILQLNNDSKNVIFTGLVTKVNRKGKPQDRVIVITEKNLYKVDPDSFKVKKEAIALSDIESINCTPKRDTVVSIHFKAGFDVLLDLGLEDDRLVEFVIEILRALPKRPTVNFSDSFSVNVAGDAPKTLTFQQDANVKKIMFKSSGKGWVALCATL